MESAVTIIVAIISSGVLNTIITYAMSAHERKKNENSGIQESLRLMMKDRLRFLCVHYIEQGWIYEDELEDIIMMHSCYHDDLNGNGFLNKLMTQVNELEVRGIGVK